MAPKIPGLQEKIEFIWNAIVDPCDAPITVYIEHMWPALRDLFLAYFAIDLKQLLIASLRPSKAFGGARQAGHFGRGKKRKLVFWSRWLRKLLNFDPNNLLGKFLPWADLARGRNISPGVATLWLLEGVIERVLFWWMVLDLITDFFYQWGSSVFETRYCQARNDAVLLAQTDALSSIPIFGWIATPFTETVKARNLDFWNGFGCAQSVGSGVAVATGSARNVDPTASGTIALRITITAGPQIGKTYIDLKDVGPGQEVEIAPSLNLLPGDLAVVEDRATGAVFAWSGLSFYVHGVSPHTP